ncbi:MAG: hypothetical protein HY059_09300 [Proteobacteria bacterium]|nr:hypothetical protein [Pseudomonadota bacterium]
MTRAAFAAALWAACLAAAPAHAAPKPALEVSASSGAVKVTLELSSAKIKVGGSLWYRATLTNVGKAAIGVYDRIFLNPQRILDNYNSHLDTFLEAVGPDGKQVEGRPASYILPLLNGEFGHMGPLPDRPPDPKGDRERAEVKQGVVASWKAARWPEATVREWLGLYESGYSKSGASEKEIFMARLEPGKSIATPPWRYVGDKEYRELDPRVSGEPVAGFAELWFWDFRKPGKYKVRAVHRRVYQGAVTATTPWLEVTVTP